MSENSCECGCRPDPGPMLKLSVEPRRGLRTFLLGRAGSAKVWSGSTRPGMVELEVPFKELGVTLKLRGGDELFVHPSAVTCQSEAIPPAVKVTLWVTYEALDALSRRETSMGVVEVVPVYMSLVKTREACYPVVFRGGLPRGIRIHPDDDKGFVLTV